MAFQEDAVVYALREILLVVGDVDERAVGVVIHIAVYDGFDQIAVAKVQSVKRLVEDQQVGTFHESPGHQNQSLLTTRHLEEFAVGQMPDTEYVHPFQTLVFFLLRRCEVKPYGVFQSAGHNLQRRDILFVAPVHLGRDVADMFLDVPDALTRTALVSEQ